MRVNALPHTNSRQIAAPQNTWDSSSGRSHTHVNRHEPHPGPSEPPRPRGHKPAPPDRITSKVSILPATTAPVTHARRRDPAWHPKIDDGRPEIRPRRRAWLDTYYLSSPSLRGATHSPSVSAVLVCYLVPPCRLRQVRRRRPGEQEEISSAPSEGIQHLPIHQSTSCGTSCGPSSSNISLRIDVGMLIVWSVWGDPGGRWHVIGAGRCEDRRRFWGRAPGNARPSARRVRVM